MNVVNAKPAQPLDDTQSTDVSSTTSTARPEPDAHRSSSRWSPWLGSRPREGTRSGAER